MKLLRSPLPGLSNRNLRIDTPSGVSVLRLSSPDGSGYVDRAHELAVTAAMSDLGIGARFVAGDAKEGWLITEFVAGAEPLTGERLVSDPIALASVVAGVRRLQQVPVRFERVFDPFETIGDYLRKLARASDGVTLDPALLAALPIAAGWVAAETPTGDGGVTCPSTDQRPDWTERSAPGATKVSAEVGSATAEAAVASSTLRRPLAAPPTAEITDPILRDVLTTLLAERAAEGEAGSSPFDPGPISGARSQGAAVPAAPDPTSLPPSFLVPAHGDPTPANMLFDGVAVTLIDWEYAAMAHPLWDFAGLAVEAALPKEVEFAMLAMAGVRPTRGYVGLKFAALMVSGLWAALRDESARPDHPIRALRDERLSLAAVLADRILAAGA